MVTDVFMPFLKDVVVVLKGTHNVFFKDHSVKQRGIPLGVCFQGVFYLVFGSTDAVNLENDGWGRHTLNIAHFGYDHAL